MVTNFFDYLYYFIHLSFRPETLWILAPLIIATLLIIIYFSIYGEEKNAWSNYLSNSLVLLFVSMSLFKYVFSINSGGYFNLVEYPAKTIAIIILLFSGVSLTKWNFEHILPERFSRHLSSPLTINTFAYGIILFVYSAIDYNIYTTISLAGFMILIAVILNLLKIPIKKLKKSIEKEKKQERFRDLKEAIFEIDELKRELKARNKELSQIRLKQAYEKEKEAIKIEKKIEKEKKRKLHLN
ncbi:MAG: hypothetical protein WCX73_01460 [Candidatus Pacearchaeota archaeon]|jgi:hypothetical protein